MDKNESIKEEIKKLLTIWRGADKYVSLQVFCYWPLVTAASLCWTVTPLKEGEGSNSALDVLAQDPTRTYGTGFTLDLALESLRSGIIQRMLDESLGVETVPTGGVGTSKVVIHSDVQQLTRTDEGDVLDLNNTGATVREPMKPRSASKPSLSTGSFDEYWKKRVATELNAETLSDLRKNLPRGVRDGVDKTTALYRLWAAANARFNRQAARSKAR